MGILEDLTAWAGRAKRLYDVSKELKNVELTESIADLRIAISEWKVKFAEIAEQNLALQAEVKELEKKLASVDDLVFRDGVYYRADPAQGKPNGPFCPNCFESQGAMISLGDQMPDFVRIAGRFVCPKSEATFA